MDHKFLWFRTAYPMNLALRKRSIHFVTRGMIIPRLRIQHHDESTWRSLVPRKRSSIFGACEHKSPWTLIGKLKEWTLISGLTWMIFLNLTWFMQNSGVGLTARRPILLVEKHPAACILVHTLFVNVGHHGREKILNDLRQQYWITETRAAVRVSIVFTSDLSHKFLQWLSHHLKEQ